MLSKFYKITSLEKKFFFLRVFSKQHSFAVQDSLVVGSNGWGFCGVVSTPPASWGGGVSKLVPLSLSFSRTDRSDKVGVLFVAIIYSYAKYFRISIIKYARHKLLPLNITK